MRDPDTIEEDRPENSNIVRRILYREDANHGEELRKAATEIQAIRDEMVDLRHRLREIAKVESTEPNSSATNDVAGAISTGIVLIIIKA